MTSAEADERIILSRQNLQLYSRMVAAGEWPSADNLVLFNDEVAILEALAVEHPVKAEKLYRLAEKWVVFIDAMRAKVLN